MTSSPDAQMRHIEYMTSRVDELITNANWSRAEAVLADDPIKREMLLKIAVANEDEAAGLATEILDCTTLLAIETRDHTNE